MKRIYVEWVDDHGKICNGNIVRSAIVDTAEAGKLIVDVERFVKVEVRE